MVGLEFSGLLQIVTNIVVAANHESANLQQRPRPLICGFHDAWRRAAATAEPPNGHAPVQVQSHMLD
jgi:hypothetical protein